MDNYNYKKKRCACERDGLSGTVSLRVSRERAHDLAIQCFTVWIGRAPYVKYICRAPKWNEFQGCNR